MSQIKVSDWLDLNYSAMILVIFYYFSKSYESISDDNRVSTILSGLSYT